MAFKMKGPSLYKSSPIANTNEERLAKQKIRSKKNKAFYDERSDEFKKDESNVYRDTEGKTVSERRRIANKELRRKEKAKKA